eukprot:scaffold76416_cov57-Phaeocystis_antarctica.AAC.2
MTRSSLGKSASFSMHEEAAVAGWGGGGGSFWQWVGRRCSSARQALAASSSSVRRECRSEAESSRRDGSGCRAIRRQIGNTL